VKKIESEASERKNLHALLVTYLHKEDKELVELEARICEQGTSDSMVETTTSIRKELALLQEKKHDSRDVSLQEKETLQTEMRGLLSRKDQITKSLGRVEAEKAFLEKELARLEEKKDVIISSDDFTDAHATVSHQFELLEHAVTAVDVENIKTQVKYASETLETFFVKHGGSSELAKKREVLLIEIGQISGAHSEYEAKAKLLDEEILTIEEKIRAYDTYATDEILSRHEEEKKVLQLQSKVRELESIILLRKQEEGELALRKQYMATLIEEGVMIVGRFVSDYARETPLEKHVSTSKHDLLRQIERSKLRIEEASVPNRDEVINEYKTTREREEYLTKELADIEESEQKLLQLIRELTEALEDKFSTGVAQVSQVFSDFFGEVFVGGKGKIALMEIAKTDDEGHTVFEQGIDIDVHLPNKKVKEITMFSGGERTLVSIALLFAMSSITPPPFMVLDETDAPLDESNARKYGMMLKRLAEKSKLLVITHNRETMNHCDMLYGVTIGSDGGSKLLSVNFKEAETYAK
jgi:chromosome segregation protein